MTMVLLRVPPQVWDWIADAVTQAGQPDRIDHRSGRLSLRDVALVRDSSLSLAEKKG